MLEYFLLGASLLYLVEYSALRIGRARMARVRPVRRAVYPTATVIVAARNEEANIERCLRGLLEQDFPADRLQIIAVNDESEDATLAIMEQLAAEHPGRLVIVTTKAEESPARGKARAIAQGMDHATGEIVLLTDADCLPPTTWVRGVVDYFQPGVDVCGGFTVIEEHSLFGIAQQLDWIHLQTLGSDALGLGFPVGVIGNNFSFRKAAYDAVGGYRAVPFTVTEDFALFQAMTRKGYRAIFPCDHDARMRSLPCETMGEMLRQKQRWARGGTENDVPGYTLFIVALVMLVAFSIAPFVSLRGWALVWCVKFFCDIMVLTPSFRALRMTDRLRYLVVFEFYFVVQMMLIPIVMFNPTVMWKGRAYR